MAYLNYKFRPLIKNQIISETFEYVHGQTQQFFQDNLAGRIANQINTRDRTPALNTFAHGSYFSF